MLFSFPFSFHWRLPLWWALKGIKTPSGGGELYYRPLTLSHCLWIPYLLRSACMYVWRAVTVYRAPRLKVPQSKSKPSTRFSRMMFLSEKASQANVEEGPGTVFRQQIHINLWNRNQGVVSIYPWQPSTSWGLNSPPPLTLSVLQSIRLLSLLLSHSLPSEMRTPLGQYPSSFTYFALFLPSQLVKWTHIAKRLVNTVNPDIK